MCGIFGWQYDTDAVTPEQRTIIGVMLAQEIESRGRDSCGYASLDGDNTIIFAKETGPIMNSTLLPEICEKHTLMGHCRYATIGAKTQENAHPWHLGHIIGAHNGGIFNHAELNTKYPERNFAVDSMHIIQHINDGLALDDLHGYGTVEWMDTNDVGAVYVCALHRGGLEIEMLGAGAQGVIWASTRTAISAALRPARLYAASRQVRVEQGVVYRIAKGVVLETDLRLKFGDESPKEVKASYTPAVAWNTEWDTHDFYNGTWRYDTERRANIWEPFKPTPPKVERKLKSVPTPSKRKRTGLSRKEARAYDKLLVICEQHRDMCECVACNELFRLQVLDDALRQGA